MENKIENSGFLLINKPKDWTSFDVVAKLRGITRIKKIGHAGTLDPMATGLLIVAIGREATKQIDTFKAKEKVYEAEIEFGKTSNTYDAEGEVETRRVILSLACAELAEASKDKVEITLKDFVGQIEQMPPAFSAKKINGVPAYKLARQGKPVELKSATVEIKNIEIIDYTWPKLKLEITCGPGTYIRSIAHDLGQKLETGAILTALKRTKIGEYELKNAKEITDLTLDNWSDFVLNT
ncbi:tRNA pseudouridine(55) synthase TruB [Candidatus Falkowbacteria bacterium CG10_big_fil_rev_8_21_14_0_10_39_11]|uniref:tRNA pseudouridine synthase B n=1 Tax=Candidatus Falkowbacteria bacterium CG10_big_fil_rev_8_21_14_0_10_39_11 TaxID=1974565 RepID=A0A2H0V4U8_9BACT|nr:MAG: tRNA pseudouridine(55) synthase TruB [Candidatus Falkowbacteria bacterium CG10_big_fil_rev_8_21_14_0_10_39_11]